MNNVKELESSVQGPEADGLVISRSSAGRRTLLASIHHVKYSAPRSVRQRPPRPRRLTLWSRPVQIGSALIA